MKALITLVLISLSVACGSKKSSSDNDKKKETTPSVSPEPKQPEVQSPAQPQQPKQPVTPKEEVKKVPPEEKKPEPTTPPVDNGNGLWGWSAGSNGSVPANTRTPGDFYGQQTAICRVVDGNAKIPGTLVIVKKGCYYGKDGVGRYSTTYEVLWITPQGENQVGWLSGVNAGNIPANAIPSGNYNDIILYLCRVKFQDGSIILGSAASGHQGCYYSINDKEYVQASNYEVFARRTD